MRCTVICKHNEFKLYVVTDGTHRFMAGTLPGETFREGDVVEVSNHASPGDDYYYRIDHLIEHAPEPDGPLRLYVWEPVLTDWTSGIAFALARSPQEAKAKLLDAGLGEHHWKGTKLDGVEPEVVEAPAGFYCYGGS